MPATLALTLGAPASFGAFPPGVAGLHGVHDRDGHLDRRRRRADGLRPAAELTNGAFALAQPLRARHVKTGRRRRQRVVAVAFKQAIAASEPLRTGNYAKTLTFTLSTTAP